MAIVTVEQLENAAEDAQTLEDVVNGGIGDSPIVPRLGGSILTLADLQEAMKESAYRWTYDNPTGVDDPGTGKIRLNNATLASVTKIAISAESGNLDNPDLSDMIATWDNSSHTPKGILRIVQSGEVFAVFNISAVTDHTTWLEIDVTLSVGSGTLVDEGEVFVSGQTGAPLSDSEMDDVEAVIANLTDIQNAEENADIAKAAAGFTYTYDDTTTASDPGAGVLRFNNATIASATELYISETTGLAQAIAAEIATWDDSSSTIHSKLRFFSQADPSIFAIFNVTGTNTDNGGWDTVTVAYVSGSGSIVDGDTLTVQPLRTGDKGLTGDTGPAGSLQIADAAGTADVLTADFTPDVTLSDNVVIQVVNGVGANTITNPTLNVDGAGAVTIKARGGAALVAGDTGSGGYTMTLRYEATGPSFELLNPAKTTAAQQSDLDIDGTLAANSDSKIPSQKAVKTYVDAEVSGISVLPTLGYETGSADDTIDATHQAVLKEFTGGTDRTFTFTAAATLGADWWTIIDNNSTAELTIDGNGTEVDGLALYKMYPGEKRLYQCNGTTIRSIVLKGFDTGSRTTTWTFTKPPGYSTFDVWLGAGGGSGGAGVAATAFGGGGGGACHRALLLASTVGATETVTIGDGGTGVVTGGNNGNTGGSTTFGSLLTAFGGAGGAQAGAGGGGALAAGSVGSSAGGAGGAPGGGDGGAAGAAAVTPGKGSSGWGGAGGGGKGTADNGGLGGAGYYGGGGGGGPSDGNVNFNGDGGDCVYGGAGGGAGAEDVSPGPGAGGTSKFGGNGGAGAYDANTGTAGTAGTNGCGGGGGGGSEAGTSGAGGKGSSRILGVV